MAYAYGLDAPYQFKIVETIAGNNLAISGRGGAFFSDWGGGGLNAEIDMATGEVRQRYYPDGHYRHGESGLGPVVYTLTQDELAIVARHVKAAKATL